MSRAQFQRDRQGDWERLELLLDELEQRRHRREPGARSRTTLGQAPTVDEFPALYRRVCQDLSLARERSFGYALIERLNRLSMRGYVQLYRPRTHILRTLARTISVEFPRHVRANARLFWASMALFWIPFLGMVGAARFAPEWIYSLIDVNMEQQLEQMYGPSAEEVGRTPEAGTHLRAFAGYIMNNVSIGFRIFAGGIALGLGTIFFLVFNGLYIGAVFGHINRLEYYENFYPFVSGHASLELIGFVISGMAGLKLGLALLAPGRMTRAQSLRVNGREALGLVFGAALMIVSAAFIEGFWSPSNAPPRVKYVVGAMMWILVLAYFLFAGRDRRAHR